MRVARGLACPVAHHARGPGYMSLRLSAAAPASDPRGRACRSLGQAPPGQGWVWNLLLALALGGKSEVGAAHTQVAALKRNLLTMPYVAVHGKSGVTFPSSPRLRRLGGVLEDPAELLTT